MSVDLRTRVLAVVAGGATHRAAAERFGVSAASVSHWRASQHRQGDVQPGPLRGDRRSIRVETAAGVILELLEQRRDATIAELRDALDERGHRFDYAGTAISNLVALFIMLTAAATLPAHGNTDIQSSAQAAEALRPLAGRFAFTILALGIVGTGLLALPVLAGSAAFDLAKALQWPVGMARRPLEAKASYGTIAAATVIEAALSFSSLNPVKALFWSAVLNGVVAVPVMVMLMAVRSDVMGRFTIGAALKTLGWLATVTMAAAAIGMFATWGD